MRNFFLAVVVVLGVLLIIAALIALLARILPSIASLFGIKRDISSVLDKHCPCGGSPVIDDRNSNKENDTQPSEKT